MKDIIKKIIIIFSILLFISLCSLNTCVLTIKNNTPGLMYIYETMGDEPIEEIESGKISTFFYERNEKVSLYWSVPTHNLFEKFFITIKRDAVYTITFIEV